MTQEKRMENVPREVAYRTICDACGNARENADPDGWHRFDSHHGEWGNDSVESCEYHDACSFACYLTIVGREFEPYAAKPHPTLEIDDKDWWFIRDMLAAMPEGMA